VHTAASAAQIESEIIIVDDNSGDGSVDTVLGLQNKGYNITYGFYCFKELCTEYRPAIQRGSTCHERRR
jgi:glycosyltransferase involved in cell wall biosynthesis